VVDLDKEQDRIVNYPKSQVIIAGPGSGKTRTLIAKAEKLYSEGVDLICLTFTRAAAKEMRDRMPGLNAMTIHSYAHDLVGWVGDYDAMLDKANVLKGKGLIKDRYDWVLVDEVQDLTFQQWEMVETSIGKYLFAVGDPFQSVYKWNEALGKDILPLLKAAGCQTFYLNNNYRSSPDIVNYLNKIYVRGLVSKTVKDLGTTAVLTRKRDQVREITSILDRHGIKHTVRHGGSELAKTKEVDKGSSKVKVMTCHCSKGLEFDEVLLYNWFPEPFWGEELNLYYVSVARASKKFTLVRDETGLIKELEKEGLKYGRPR
jgi:superfamily I DNA/RNA helicase